MEFFDSPFTFELKQEEIIKQADLIFVPPYYAFIIAEPKETIIRPAGLSLRWAKIVEYDRVPEGFGALATVMKIQVDTFINGKKFPVDVFIKWSYLISQFFRGTVELGLELAAKKLLPKVKADKLEKVEVWLFRGMTGTKILAVAYLHGEKVKVAVVNVKEDTLDLGKAETQEGKAANTVYGTLLVCDSAVFAISSKHRYAETRLFSVKDLQYVDVDVNELAEMLLEGDRHECEPVRS